MAERERSRAGSPPSLSGRCDAPISVQVPGGVLTVSWQRGGRAYLTGPP